MWRKLKVRIGLLGDMLASNLACSKEQHPFAAAEYARHTPGHKRRQRSSQQGS
jgi:hypothetical protein